MKTATKKTKLATVSVKTQTKRSVLWKENINNVNILGDKFSIGVECEKGWGFNDYTTSEEQHVVINIDDVTYNVPLSKFKEIGKEAFSQFSVY